MAKFRFYQDVEVITTRREYYEIEADSLDDAREKASNVSNLDDCDEAEYIESELLLDDIRDSRDWGARGIYDSEGEDIE